MTDPWASTDALGESLHLLRMSGVFYSHAELTAPWGIALPRMPDCLMFHVVTAGECWLEGDDTDDRLLRPGVFALVPHGEGHRLTSARGEPAVDLFSIPREQLSERYEFIRYGEGGSACRLVCGAVRFDHPAAQQLVRLLPRTISVEGWESPQADWIQSTLRLMGAEARERQPGGEAVITRLADILVIQAIRAWLAGESAATGWLGALKDRGIGRAIISTHRAPERDWTVESLAREAHMSRSAFSARFKELVGEGPMAYVTRWRMQLAVTWLRESEATPGDLPGRLGYNSEAAFSRAFKRIIGVSPGAVRRRAETVSA